MNVIQQTKIKSSTIMDQSLLPNRKKGDETSGANKASTSITSLSQDLPSIKNYSTYTGSSDPTPSKISLDGSRYKGNAAGKSYCTKANLVTFLVMIFSMIILSVVAELVVDLMLKSENIKEEAYDLLKEFLSTFVQAFGGALGSGLIIYFPIKRQLESNRLVKVMETVKEMQGKMIEIESENNMDASNFKRIYNVYGSDIVQFLNGIVYNYFGSCDDWAKSFAQNEFGEMEYDSNRMRKVLLTLVNDFNDYCEATSQIGNQEEPNKSITKIFKGTEIIHLLDICLPMDKAQCLYKMKLKSGDLVGMIWIGKSDLEKLKNIFANNSEIYHFLVGNDYTIDDVFDTFYQHSEIFKIRYGQYLAAEAPYWIAQKYPSLAKEIDNLKVRDQ